MLMLKVHLSKDERRLFYTLRYKFTRRSFKSEILTRKLSEYFEELFKSIEEDKHSTEDPLRMFDGIGNNLTENLLPRNLEELLWEKKDQEDTLHIRSDEIWIPWEILKIRRPVTEDDAESGYFLCEAFNLTRWRPHLGGCHLHFPLRTIALVGEVPPDDSTVRSVDSSGDECTGISESVFLKRQEGPERTVQIAAGRDLMRYLASGRFDAFHLIGHGEARGDPDSWRLRFHDGGQLQPGDLSDGQARRAGNKRPLIFLNACQTGRSSLALAGPGGWAEKFLGLGAGAFIGTLWSTTEDASAHFANKFYKHFLEEIPIGEAVRRARISTRDCFPGNPTWLAYVVFGSPLATCAEPPPSRPRNRRPIVVLVPILLVVTVWSLFCPKLDPRVALDLLTGGVQELLNNSMIPREDRTPQQPQRTVGKPGKEPTLIAVEPAGQAPQSHQNHGEERAKSDVVSNAGSMISRNDENSEDCENLLSHIRIGRQRLSLDQAKSYALPPEEVGVEHLIITAEFLKHPNPASCKCFWQLSTRKEASGGRRDYGSCARDFGPIPTRDFQIVLTVFRKPSPMPHYFSFSVPKSRNP